MNLDLSDLEQQVRSAVSLFWSTRAGQRKRQTDSGAIDQGTRAEVTGGKQLDGFAKLLCQMVKRAGIGDAAICRSRGIDLPGYFRATKKWDMLIVVDGKLLAVIELKSQIGPSFGNNFNNRAEEAIGSAVDLWTAYREGAFKDSPSPWMGYLFLLEDCEKSRSAIKVEEPHFSTFPEFHGASYMKRYELLCRKLVLERQYEAAAFLTSCAADGLTGVYSEPAADLSMRQFVASLMGKMAAYATTRKQG